MTAEIPKVTKDVYIEIPVPQSEEFGDLTSPEHFEIISLAAINAVGPASVEDYNDTGDVLDITIIVLAGGKTTACKLCYDKFKEKFASLINTPAHALGSQLVSFVD